MLVRLAKWLLVWAVVVALAFWLLYWVAAIGIAVMGAIVVVVLALGADWEEHSTFEEREQRRAEKRKDRSARTAAAREKDRALYRQHQAARAQRDTAPGSGGDAPASR